MLASLSMLGRIHGQTAALDLFRHAIQANRLHHAYLFVGPEGVGKRTTALALAAALECTTRPGEGCGVCIQCDKVATGIHPDVLLLEPEGKGEIITVKAVRDLIAKLAYAPHEGNVRVVILDPAHRMNLEAANAFLKTLEEPPARSHFLLLTSSPEQLPLTVRSRCQRVRFGPLSAESVEAILFASGVAAADARTAARLAGGSAARASDLAAEDVTTRRLGWLRKILEATTTPGFRPVIEVAAALSKEKEEVAPVLELLALYYRDAAAQAAGATPSLWYQDLSRDLRPDPEATTAGLARRAACVLDAEEAVRSHAQAQLAVERMLLALREAEH